ncbi:MAG: Gfo/Idh/MocA family oxidoreductase [Clostridia bacterium]|nr:Gfo/Idh/MocA family oxidoreductase [Clostridia bacterium]
MLRIGVIGCGKITQVRHAPEYAEHADCSLAAWYDAIPERAQAMADQYGGRVCQSVDELLELGLDAVSVCVANRDHADVTIRALEAGCHVLCEKPMAVTIEECESMLEAARRTGKMLMLGHNQRYNKSHMEARRMILSGEAGRPLAFHTCFTHPGPEGWTGQKNSWFIHKSQSALGAIADLGIHKTDLIHYLLGESIVSVSAMLGTLDKAYEGGAPIDVEDNALCLYRTQSGVMGQMHVGWTNYGHEDNSTRIYTTEGVIRLYDDPDYSLIFERRNGETLRLNIDEMTTNQKQTDGLRESTGIIDAFVECIQTGVPASADASECIKAMRVIFAAVQSAEEGRTVSIP